MVRLEKVILEKFLNSKPLKRQRAISSPSKWYKEDKIDNMLVAATKIYDHGISGKIFKYLEPAFAYLGYNWIRDIGL
jgi:hypothetical protein